MTPTPARQLMVGVPAAAIAAIHSALAVDRTTGEAAEAARQLGFATGAGFYDAFQDWVGASETRDAGDLDPDGFWDLLSRFFAEHGWGHLQLEHLHPGVTSLTSPDWREAERIQGARHPSCHVTTGLLAEMLGRVGGEELAVMEVQCRARGDAQCRFLIGGRPALERIFESLRTGRDLGQAMDDLG